ncbi:hypothetical protein BsWGS_11700 [Bradybaena similaris]
MFIVFLLFYMAQHSNESAVSRIINVKITSEAQCDSFKTKGVDVDPNAVYKIQMGMLNNSCLINPEQYGFDCEILFYQKDFLALVESQLCVDLQGVPQTIPNTQLTLTVFSQQRILKEVDKVSQIPDDVPYYVCSDVSRRSLSVSLSVRKSVRMCPSIMDKLVGYNISFGSVMMRPTMPTYSVSMENCYPSITVRDDAYIVKVTPEGFSAKCQLPHFKNHSFTYTNSCVEVIYVSPDYICNISVELLRYPQSVFKFVVIQGGSFSAKGRQLFCASYSSAENDGDLDYILVIQKNTTTDCFGNFAIRATVTEVNNDVTEDTYADKMRTIYMAVFISLMFVCLLILCVTCIFCLRMRAKRARRAQRQGLNNGPNEGFEASHTHDTSVSWNQNIADEVHGLPTYDEICGKNTDTNANHEEPPAYDALFSSDV